MSEENKNTPAEQDYLNMSDEEIMAMGEPDFPEEDPADEPAEPEDVSEEVSEEGAEGEQSEPDEDLNDDADEEDETEQEEEPQEEQEEDEGPEEEYQHDESTEEEEPSEDDSEDSEDEEDVDNEEETNEHKQQLDELFSPFKANGKEIQVSTIAEARQLMQMGANYAKKMGALKPHLRLVKTMEKHNVSEQDLSFFIDLKKKDPTAIARFLKDSGVDPLDLDLETSSEYKPQTYTASDEEVELSQTLAELKELPGYNETLNIVGNKWDSQSRQVLKSQPNALRTLQSHVSDGTYHKVMAEVEKQRMFGNLNGVSDLEAYDMIGSQMFGQQQESQNEQVPEKQPTKRVVKRVGAKKSSDNPNNKSRKKAAGLTGKNAKKSNEPDYNPLEMSDEEYEKMLSQSSKFV